ncbi:MAG: hypothetical protein KDA61_14955 [Planctomycetales bacterium]|nr:hypothetical protein [Planctomycetales bacterium]
MIEGLGRSKPPRRRRTTSPRTSAVVRIASVLIGCVGGSVNATEGAGEPVQQVIVVVGAAGEAAFGERFERWAAALEQVCDVAQIACSRVGPDDVDAEPGEVSSDTRTQKDRLEKTLLQTNPQERLWLVLFGHGTFDGKTARFNLKGPDLSAEELDRWLDSKSCDVAVINCASASGPFIPAVAGPNRVVIAATNSGYELNFARFGEAFASAWTAEEADGDKDHEISLLEAFLYASRRTSESYREDGALATEHALLDDNGDGRGVAADWWTGSRRTSQPNDGAAADGRSASQWVLAPLGDEHALSREARERRDAIESELERLRKRKTLMSEGEYYESLAQLATELARIYRDVDPK